MLPNHDRNTTSSKHPQHYLYPMATHCHRFHWLSIHLVFFALRHPLDTVHLSRLKPSQPQNNLRHANPNSSWGKFPHCHAHITLTLAKWWSNQPRISLYLHDCFTYRPPPTTLTNSCLLYLNSINNWCKHRRKRLQSKTILTSSFQNADLTATTM